MIAAIKQQSQPTTKWYPMFANLGDYRGWGIQMVLILNQGDRYRVEVTKFHTFEQVVSDVWFTYDQKTQALAYAHGLIDWDENFSPLGKVETYELPF